MLFTMSLYLFFGAIAGILAGLLGLGGGVVIVPMLNYAFALEGIPEGSIQIMAVATSMACILFTSISSVRAHHKHGSVNWPVWKRITPGILVGTFCGTWIAVLLSQTMLRGFFIVYLVTCAVQMWRPLKVASSQTLPGQGTLLGAGGIIGAISSLVGIGGGTMSVPFLSYCSLEFRACIGTSAAIGFPIALAGTVGYILNGWNDPALPPHSLGYIYLPACLGVVAASMVFATLGAKWAHRVPVAKLRRIFAIFLIVVATDMLCGML